MIRSLNSIPISIQNYAGLLLFSPAQLAVYSECLHSLVNLHYVPYQATFNESLCSLLISFSSSPLATASMLACGMHSVAALFRSSLCLFIMAATQAFYYSCSFFATKAMPFANVTPSLPPSLYSGASRWFGLSSTSAAQQRVLVTSYTIAYCSVRVHVCV